MPIDALLEDPVEAARAIVPFGAPHPKIASPRELFAPERLNSAGLDLSNEARLAEFGAALRQSAGTNWRAGAERPPFRAVLNPADTRDVVGEVADAGPGDVEFAFRRAAQGAADWGAREPRVRAAILTEAAARFEREAQRLAGLICREAGKTLPNALADVREAVDFLRYYAARIATGFENATHRPLGVIVSISPWNFPIAIFTGQIAAALAAGNAVIAKPAEETPLIAAAATRLLHEAGVPQDALILAQGDGTVGAALTTHDGIGGVMFTGSTEVARHIAASLAERLGPDGAPIPLIAETGGQNAMIVDSSALAEQVVGDVLTSAFDSAGQRCSALRVLCLQEDIAERTIALLKAAMRELDVGPPDRLSADVGPVISEEALERLTAYVETMRGRGFSVHAEALGPACAHGFFIAPTLIEIHSVADLGGEVFGPVLQVLRYKRENLLQLIDTLNATGYALTGGVHSRIDSTIDLVSGRLAAGNIYVNRNIIGAVVGAQPFGGHALSGTGPKAGGPLYLKRLLASAPADWPFLPPGTPARAAETFAQHLASRGHDDLAHISLRLARASRLGSEIELPGPVGECNLYSLHPRGAVLCDAASEDAMIVQIGCALAAGNRAVLQGAAAEKIFEALPGALLGFIVPAMAGTHFDAVLTDREGPALLVLSGAVARRDGPIVQVFSLSLETLRRGAAPLDFLLREQSVCVNTTATGGNASLMSIG